MTPNKRDLKAYVRYDGSGRVVPGSLVLRRKKPKVGRWTEVQGYECCNGPQLIITPDPPTWIYPDGFSITINCPFSDYQIVVEIPQATNSIAEAVAALNAYAGYLGTFAVSVADSSSVIFTANMDASAAFINAGCPGNITGGVKKLTVFISSFTPDPPTPPTTTSTTTVPVTTTTTTT